MSVMVELSIFPLDKGDSLSQYVSRAVQIIKDSGLNYSLGPMGTSFEGAWEEVMDVVDRCFTELQKDSDRIYIALKADYRTGQENRMQEKVESVLDKLED